MFQSKMLNVFAATLISASSMVVSPAAADEPIKGIAKATLPDKQLLRYKLSQVRFFSANFTQTIQDEMGVVLQKAEGELTVAKPNKVNWHTKLPEETLIVSDGTTLWFYDPFIEQATAYNIDSTIENTPILLITNDDPLVWQKFDVVQTKEAVFRIASKDLNNQVRVLELSFDSQSMIQSIRIEDSTGQISDIKLSGVNVTTQPAREIFQFSLPEGVALDDQR